MRQPVLFIGHGSPMNAIEDNAHSRAWRALANGLRPRAILAISAHWYRQGQQTTAMAEPPTIHDFGGFPEALYKVQYPAPGDPGLAREVADLVGAEAVQAWGLDHGTWSVLRHMFPDADVPVVQLSVDPTVDAIAVGERLRALREDVLIVASGNVTHNLREFFADWQQGTKTARDYASRFDEAVAQAVVADDVATVRGLLTTPDGRRAHPSPDHFLPLLYAYGAGRGDPVTFPHIAMEGSLSMRCVRFG